MSAGRLVLLLLLGMMGGLLLGLGAGLPSRGEAAGLEALPAVERARAEAPYAIPTRLGGAGARGPGEGNAPRADAAPLAPAPIPAPVRPRIAVVIDDLGLDRAAFDRINALPGPLTLAFLPYGEDAQAMLDAAAPEHDTLLHLPTEPHARREDAGPDMLRPGPPAAILGALNANLAKLSGFDGVNNHTGSLFTEDPGAMAVLLSALDARGLYFLDSVTTPRPVARRLAQSEGWRVAQRDVFLDDDYAAGEALVRARLLEAERLARANGHAVVIGHPYKATARALGPWLASAPARGIDLVTVGDLTGEAAPPRTAALR